MIWVRIRACKFSVSQQRRTDQGVTQLVIGDRNLTEPPGSPADGFVLHPASVATGAWAGMRTHCIYSNNSGSSCSSEGWLA
jgi:hypothetical protein